MTIYQVNRYNALPDFIVPDQATVDAAVGNPLVGAAIIGTQADAQTRLVQYQQECLAANMTRFSICATFVNGTDQTWREMQDTDPEDFTYLVFNQMTGQYTSCSSKTLALQENEARKAEFLALAKLDQVYPVDALPVPPAPKTTPTTSTTVV